MKPVSTGRKMLATVGSVVLGAGLAVTLAPASGTAATTAPSVERQAADRPKPVAAPSGPAAKTLAEAFPARLGTLGFTSVYGTTTTKSSSGKRLVVALSAWDTPGTQPENEPSFYISLSRGSNEQHSWSFPGPNSSFDINAKAAGKLVLSAKKTGGMGKVALKVKPDGKMKSHKCGGKVYAKERNVVISGTFFFDSDSKWGKVGSKRKPFKFASTHRVWFSYNVECPPVKYPDTCYNQLSWSSWRETANGSSYISATKEGTKSAIYASRFTELAKPKGAWRSDSVWGTGGAPMLTENGADNSATMKIYGVRGSGTITAPPDSAFTWDDPCDGGNTQHVRSWWGGTVANDATPLKIPAQVFGSFTVPDGTPGYMSRAWFD